MEMLKAMKNEWTNAAAVEKKKITQPLPCPFCGKLPRVKCGKVSCKNPACMVQPKSFAWYTSDSPHIMIADWNKRA